MEMMNKLNQDYDRNNTLDLADLTDHFDHIWLKKGLDEHTYIETILII